MAGNWRDEIAADAARTNLEALVALSEIVLGEGARMMVAIFEWEAGTISGLVSSFRFPPSYGCRRMGRRVSTDELTGVHE